MHPADDALTVAALDHRVRALTDHHDIETLVHRLGACLDDARFEDLRSIFVAEATARTGGGYAEGIDAMIAQAGRNHAADDHIQHRISGVLVDLDGDEAAVRANLVVTFAPGGDAPSPRRSLGEVYRFGARRTSAGWRLTRVTITLVWESTVPARAVS